MWVPFVRLLKGWNTRSHFFLGNFQKSSLILSADTACLPIPLVIELYAYQFDWRARYSGIDNTLGKANVRLIEGVNQLGVDISDPNAQDDKVVNELHLPLGRKVLFKMRSQDVLHSAYMPHFRAQMNCVPGMITQFAFTPSMTTIDMRMNDEVIAKVETQFSVRKTSNTSLTFMNSMEFLTFLTPTTLVF